MTIIWFQHVHKTGGSSIVRMARNECVNFYKPESNGNPMVPTGSGWPLYEGHNGELDIYTNDSKFKEEFQDSCKDVDFVCAEWELSHFAPSNSFKFTILRDPYERFISNVNFDLMYNSIPEYGRYEIDGKIYNENSELEYSIDELYDVWCSVNKKYLHGRDSYYCRLFSGQRESSPIEEMTEMDYIKAMSNLQNFDYIHILRENDEFDYIRCVTGWSKPSVKVFENVSTKLMPSHEYYMKFKEKNEVDYVICKKISNIEVYPPVYHSNNSKNIRSYIMESSFYIRKQIKDKQNNKLIANYCMDVLKSIPPSVVRSVLPSFEKYFISSVLLDYNFKVDDQTMKCVEYIAFSLSYLLFYCNRKDMFETFTKDIMLTVPRYKESCEKNLEFC